MTGFLDDKSYIQLLNSSDAIMVLTKRDDCLNCGAYEAISIGRPLILSDSFVLREYFYQGVSFTENNSNAITACVFGVKEKHEELEMSVASLKSEVSDNWDLLKQSANKQIADFVS